MVGDAGSSGCGQEGDRQTRCTQVVFPTSEKSFLVWRRTSPSHCEGDGLARAAWEAAQRVATGNTVCCICESVRVCLCVSVSSRQVEVKVEREVRLRIWQAAMSFAVIPVYHYL